MTTSEDKPAARPLELPQPTGDARLDSLARLMAIIDRLRDPDGCPWDREQTLESIAPNIIEEAFELVEAIEAGDDASIAEEAGDILMIMVLLSRIASDGGRFDVSRVADGISEKLIRRHTHVFGDVVVDGAGGALDNWERVKRSERRSKKGDQSALAGVPRALPAIQRAQRIGSKARSAGFRWEKPEDALAKVEEELGELKAAFDAGDKQGTARELGDLLFAGALFARYAGLDAERDLRASIRRFEERFRHMESELGGDIDGAPLATLLEAWDRAKASVGDGTEDAG